MGLFSIVWGVLLVILSAPVGSVITEMAIRKPVMIAFWVLGFALIIYGAIRMDKDKMQEAEKKQEISREPVIRWDARFSHAAGLPISGDAPCALSFDGENLTVRGAGQEFILPEEKISDVSVLTHTEIQKSFVSDAGDAIGGAMLFGSLGAMIGGRVKEMTAKVETYYLVITYSTAGEVKYLAFEVPEKKIDDAKYLKTLVVWVHRARPSSGPITL